MGVKFPEAGKMDWTECTKKRIVKSVGHDKNLIESIKKIADTKIESSDMLPAKFYYSKISLLYDALRELLECLALKHGYKIYNHECYAAFLKEIMHLTIEADIFDKLRKTRNGINYYGMLLSAEEAEGVIKELKELIKMIKIKNT